MHAKAPLWSPAHPPERHGRAARTRSNNGMAAARRTATRGRAKTRARQGKRTCHDSSEYRTGRQKLQNAWCTRRRAVSARDKGIRCGRQSSERDAQRQAAEQRARIGRQQQQQRQRTAAPTRRRADTTDRPCDVAPTTLDVTLSEKKNYRDDLRRDDRERLLRQAASLCPRAWRCWGPTNLPSRVNARNEQHGTDESDDDRR